MKHLIKNNKFFLIILSLALLVFCILLLNDWFNNISSPLLARDRNLKAETRKSLNGGTHLVDIDSGFLVNSIYVSVDLETRKSFLTILNLMKKMNTSSYTVENLLGDLEALKLRPTQYINDNPLTGRMNIVRNLHILKGTRYFHAQYFSEEGSNDNAYLQHLSFEVKPSEDAFRFAKDTITKSFKLENISPSVDKDGYISWNLPNDRVLWIKKLETSDLVKKDPFNSYSIPDDIGTIVITLEEEIH